MKKLPLILIVLVSALLASRSFARDIVVSPGDALEKARDAAQAGDRIVLHGGTYRLSETLVLGPRNSGVTWMAAPEETAIISGGMPVTGWMPDANGIWKAKLDRKEKLRQFYVNDQPANMAEGPTLRPTGWQGEFLIKGDEPWAADGPGKALDGLRFQKADLPKVSNPPDLEFQQQELWTIQRVGVRSMVDAGKDWAFWLDQPAAAIANKFQWGCSFWVGPATRIFNAYEFISKPGDFYFNTATGWLYYKPYADEDMAKAVAVAPRLETLVLVKGENLKSHAQHIRFESITFAHSAFQMMKIKGSESRGDLCIQSDAMSVMYKNTGNPHIEPYGLYATMDVPPAAVMVTSAGDVTFHRCAFRNLGALALNLENDVAGADVTGNVFQWVEGACVSVGHPQHTYIGKQNGDNNGWGPYDYDNSHDKWDESIEGLAKNITVSNNLFRNVCWSLIQMIPITVYAGHEVSILHNDIANTPYSGITCGWNWGEANGLRGGKYGGKPSLSMDGLRVNHNRIINPSQALGDSANIYFVGDLACQTKNPPAFQQGLAEVIGNYLTEDRGRARADLIGCDEGTSYVRIEGNVLDGRTGVSSVIHRGTGDRCKIFMHNWIGYHEMENERNFKDQNVLVAENHFVQRPPNTTLKQQDWPKEARKIIDNAGLEPAYQDLFQQIDTPLTSAFGGHRKDYGRMVSAEGATVTTSSILPGTGDGQALLSDSCTAPFAFHTGAEANPWVTIELDKEAEITGVLVRNRTDGLQERARNLRLQVSDDGQSWREVWKATDVQASWKISLLGRNIKARYLRLDTHDTAPTSLHLQHVEVWGK